MNSAQAQRRALVAAGLLIVLWGASFSLQKAAYFAMGPGAYLFGRSLVMAWCAGLLLSLRGKPLWPQLARDEWPPFVRLTLVGPVLHIGVVTYGIHWSTAFSSALIMACGPVCTLLLLRVLRGTRLQRRQLVGVVAAFAGVLLVVSDKLLGAHWQAGIGDAVLLASVLLFSLYTIWVTPLVVRYGGLPMMCWTTLLAAPVLMLVTSVAAWQAPWAAITPGVWLAFFWVVLVSAFMGWMLWGWINATLGVARTAPLMYGVPPVAGLVAWASAGEAFGPLKMLGALLALGGVAATQFAARSARPAAP